MVMVVGKGGPPPGLKPHLRVRLKPGWRWDARRRRLVSPEGEAVAAGEGLPKGSRIVPVAPALAAAAPESLGPDEEELARHLQVILPAGADPAKLLPRVREWEGVEAAEPPPEVSLPGVPAAR